MNWDTSLLSDGSYTVRLRVSDVAGNESFDSINVNVDKTAPQITGVTASPNPFSPNGDGYQDKTTLFYTLNEGAKITIDVLDAGQTRVRRLINNQDKAPGSQATDWNGKTDSGAEAPQGSYTFKITAVDYAGNSGAVTKSVRINNTLGRVSVTPTNFSPNGDGAQDTARLNVYLANDSTVTVQVYQGSTIIRTIASNLWQAAGGKRYLWDGKNDAGTLLADGSYSVKITAVNWLGTVAVSHTVFLDNTSPVVSNLAANPNPFIPDGISRVVFSYNLSEAAKVYLKITDSTGEDVYQTLPQKQAAGARLLTWNGKDIWGNLVIPDIYTYKLYVTDQAGNNATAYPASGTLEVR